MNASRGGAAEFRSQVRSAVIWRSGSQVVGQLVQWAATFLVLRILAPSDYGLYAMAAVVQTLLGLLNGFGLANALVQRKRVTQFELRQLFGMLLVVNGALAAAQFLAAPLVAQWYGEPQVTAILRVLAIGYLANPFLALGYAVLAREMDFRRQAKVNIFAAVAGALAALGGALAGLGVWTLVLAPLVVFAIRGLGMAIAARALLWPSFDFRGTRHMAGYGGTVTLSTMLYFAQTQSDVVIAGRAVDAHTLGLYTTALFLAQLFVNKVVPPLNEVAFTAYARMQDDRAGFANGFLTAVRAIMLVSIPFCLGLSVTADPLVHVVLGEKWLGVGPYLQLIALAIPFMTLQVLFAPATNALDRPGIAARSSAFGAVLMPLAFLTGIQWGVIGMAAAWLVAYPMMTLATARWSLPVIGVAWRDLGKALAPPVLAGIAMAAGVLAVDYQTNALAPLPRLALLVTVGAAIYLGGLAIFAPDRLRELVAFVRHR